MEPVGPRRVQESKDESEADMRCYSASEIEETRSMEMAAEVTEEEIKISTYDQWIDVISQQEAVDETPLGQDHSASSAQQGPTDTVNKQHRCDVCKKVFMALKNLRRHELTHTGERPFKCPYCGKEFTESGNLDRHQRKHTGKRPYACTQPGCDKAFSRGDNGPYASLAAMFSNRVRHFDCVINRGC